MAKRRMTHLGESSLDRLASELRELDNRRAAVAKQLRQATERLLSGDTSFSPAPQGREAPKAKRGRKRRTMSAAAREAISRAQKARWAKQRAAGSKTK